MDNSSKDMMGFADSKKLRGGMNLVDVGVACTIIGVCMTIAGLVITDKTAQWFKGTTDEHTQYFTKWFNDMLDVSVSK